MWIYISNVDVSDLIKIKLITDTPLVTLLYNFMLMI